MFMQFVNPRRSTNNIINNTPMLTFSSKRVHNLHSDEIVKKIPAVTKNDPKKIKWGPPTWYLFHTLAHKVKDEHFLTLRADLINNIMSICRNLPCPKCAAHASDYVSKININAIRTKEDLKNMLFKFHNDVNGRVGNSQFSYEELNGKYATSITLNIIQNFFIMFQDKSFNVSAIANSMHRTRVIATIKTWIKDNIQHFDP
jgi:hypothetical protein